MRLRAALMIACLTAGLAGSAIASPLSDAASELNGEWIGGDIVLKIDAKRAQASIDRDRPFAWERFIVKDVTPDEVVFSVGAELFQARVADDTLTLTGTSFRGAKILFRDTPLRGSTD